MAQFYFHCSSAEEVLVDRRGTDLEDLAEAHAKAKEIARTIMTTATGLQDWRDWIVHVSDEYDDEIFLVPFGFLAGKLH